MDRGRVIAVRSNKTVYKDGDLCIKVFGEEFSKAGVFNEALNLAYVEETGLNVPKVLDITKIDGKWAIVSEYIKGTNLEYLMEQNPEKTDEYLELFVSTQKKIAEKRCPMMCRLTDKITEKIRRSDIKATIRFGLYERLGSMPYANELCHGDFVPSNILVGDDGKTYILDWAHAASGSALCDAAKTYLILMITKKEEIAHKYLELFTSMYQADIKDVKKWIPLAAASYEIHGGDDERKYLDACINLVADK